MRVWYILPALLILQLTRASHAAEMTPAIVPGELDLPQCVVQVDERVIPSAPAASLAALLGLQPAGVEIPAWTTGPVAGKDRYFRLAFTHPVAIGTVCTSWSEPGTVSYLKSTAAYPGVLTDDAQWVALAAGTVKPLPVNVTTRALRFTERIADNRPPTASTMPLTMLLKDRYYSATLRGGEKILPAAQGQQEAWMGFWIDPLPIAGLVCLPQRAPTARIEALKAAAVEHPMIAPPAQWRTLKSTTGAAGPLAVAFEAPVSTRGIRISPTQGGKDWGANMGPMALLVPLGTAPEPPRFTLPDAPFSFPYRMPMDGFIAIDITEKNTGKHVRRLVAEVARTQGAIREFWDLKDDAGNYVAPGEYQWTGIARPPLKLTYEITVNNAGQPAWWAPDPAKGGGGWMADHTPPEEACAFGSFMLLGSACAESGHAMIVTDLAGNKLWGRTNIFGGFLGVSCLAGTERYGYIINGNGILRLDAQNQLQTSEVKVDLGYSNEVPGPGSGWGEYFSGAAARGDRLYLAYNVPSIPSIRSAFAPSDVNLMKCVPLVRRVRGNSRDAYKEGDYDEIQQFHATFMDGSDANSRGMSFGEAPTTGSQAGMLTVAFNAPVPVGSLVIPDGAVAVYALKPGKEIPDSEATLDPADVDPLGDNQVADAFTDPCDPAYWVRMTGSGTAGHPGVVALPEGFATKALRFKTKRLDFAQVFNRRFADIAPQATRVFVEGDRTANGGWSVTRDPKTRPITAYDQPSMALVWDTPVTVRGATLIHPTTAYYAFDVWIGPANGDPSASLQDDAMWKQCGEIKTEMHGPYPQEANARSVDFADEFTTRAIRVRATAPAGTRSYMGGEVPVSGPHQAGFDALLIYHHLGNDPVLPPELPQRITEVQVNADATGRVIRQLPLVHPGYLAFHPDGTLYAQSDGAIVTVPLTGGQSRVVIAKGVMGSMGGMAFDADGLLYVADRTDKVVKVFNVVTGAQVRTIGTPGGQRLGSWDPTRVDNPSGVAVAADGKVWVVDYSSQPKRVSRWTRDGKLEQFFLGPTQYGGGGCLDPGDKSVLNFNGMKFKIDWTTHTWALDSLLKRPGALDCVEGPMPDRVLYAKGVRYLAGDPGTGQVALLCTERENRAVALVAAGNLAVWGEVDKRADLRKAFGTLNRGDYGFLWMDDNGDGLPQAAEVQVTKKHTLTAPYWATRIGDDLSLNFAGARLRPVGFRPDGTPRYDLQRLEIVPALGISWTGADGRAFSVDDYLLDADGSTMLWRYPDDYLGVHGSHRIGYDRPPGTLVGENLVVGHFTVGKEELFVTNGNHGDWFAFTKDGLLAATLFGGPAGYGQKQWTMPEWEPGKVDLSDLSLGEEHFGGYVCAAEDGNVYAVAGHNHNSVVRIDGLAQMQRLTGTMTVRREQVQSMEDWLLQKAAFDKLHEVPSLAQMTYLDRTPDITGSLDEWEPSAFLPIHQYWDDTLKKVVVDSQAALAYDAQYLYIAAQSQDESPMRNSANQDEMTRLFKFGDALDVMLGMDATADPLRQMPVNGDLRILITRINGKPTAVVYRFDVPNAPAEKQLVFTSPITSTTISWVEVLTRAKIVIKDEGMNGAGWTVEAAIPWDALGVSAPRLGMKLRGDVGVLQSDQNGMRTVNRLYWSGKTQTIVSDLAFEARITPSLWGELMVTEPDKQMQWGPDDVDLGL